MTEYVYLALLRRPGHAATHKSVHTSHAGALAALEEVCGLPPTEADHQFERGGNQHRLSRWSYIHTQNGDSTVQRVERKEVRD